MVRSQLTERLATIGTVRANEEVEIVSEISGKISAIHFDEGSRVAAGQLLLKIDDSELIAERQRALYRVELAERAEARQQQLLDDGVISSETYDVALGELNVLRAELQLIEAQLLKTEIRAPFGGVIGLRWVSPGSYLSSQTRIASLHDLDPVKIDFSVPERYSALMKIGRRDLLHRRGYRPHLPGHDLRHRTERRRRHPVAADARAVPQQRRRPASRHLRQRRSRPCARSRTR